MLQNRLPHEVVYTRIRGTTEEERVYTCDALPCEVVGINNKPMMGYVHLVAECFLTGLVYNVDNPFDRMELIFLQGEVKVVEKRVGEYQKAGVMQGGRTRKSTFIFALDADF